MQRGKKKSNTPSDARNRSQGQSPGDNPKPKDDVTEDWEVSHWTDVETNKTKKDDDDWDKEISQKESIPSKPKNLSWNEQMVEEELKSDDASANKEDRISSQKESRDRRDDRRGNRTFSNSNYKGRDRDSRSFGGRRSEPARGHQNEERTADKRSSFNERERSWRDSSNGRRKNRKDPSEDGEFLQYQEEMDKWTEHLQFVKVREVTSDLFEAEEEYSLAHCVAEDMNMGSGIAVAFRHKFKRVGELLNQHQRTGGLAILQDKDRFIYYLVTKKFSTGKPTLSTLFSSLKCLRDHVIENKIDKIAMPRIGCGLDRLDWAAVKVMIEFLFTKVDIDIVICNLEPTEDASPQKHRNCKVAHEKYPIQDIESGTIILYFSSEDEFVSEEMEKLDEKFHFLREFKFAKKTLGDVVFYGRNSGYLLCGCIVRKGKTDRFDFVALQKCLSQIQKENKKHNHYYYAFQAMRDRSDFVLNYKVINMLRNSLRDVEVYVCWPGDLQNEMAPRDRFGDERDSFTKSEESREKGDRYSKARTAPGGDDWRQKDSGARRETKEFTPVRDNGHKEQDRSFHSNRPSSPVQDNRGPEIPESKDSVENPTETNSNWFEGPSVGEVESAQATPQVAINQEYERFKLDLEADKIDISRLREPDILKFPPKCSRVCFAREDLSIYGGIPSGEDFKLCIGKLLSSRGKEGGLVCVEEKIGFLYCLVTSRADSQPKSQSVFSCIQKLRDHVRRSAVKNLVIPVVDTLGDGLKWQEVKSMFGFLLGKMQIDVTLGSCEAIYSQATLMKRNKIQLAHKRSGIHQMPKKSVILYVTSADGHFTQEMTGLAKKFGFSDQFNKKEKVPGDVIKYKQDEDYVLYGCIVKRNASDCVDFEEFSKCLTKVRVHNATYEKLGMVGIQALKDGEEGINLKMITLLLHSLQEVKVQVCWPGALSDLMPKS